MNLNGGNKRAAKRCIRLQIILVAEILGIISQTLYRGVDVFRCADVHRMSGTGFRHPLL